MQPTTKNDSELVKQHENSTEGRRRVARHQLWRKKETDCGGDEQLCGSELKPEAGTRQGNDGSQREEVYAGGTGCRVGGAEK
jgi:hypothetical protein